MTRVLIATSLGGYAHAAICDEVLGSALQLRNAEVEYLLCDKALPACQMTKMSRSSPEAVAAGEPMPFCDKCIAEGLSSLGPVGVPIQKYSDWITPEEAERAREIARSTPFGDIRHYVVDGVHVGDHSHAGALRFFARSDLEEEPHGEGVLRQFFQSGLRTKFITERLIRERAYDVVVTHHGIYTPQGIICETARLNGCRTVTYNPAYRRSCFIFSHDRSYHYTMIEEDPARWSNITLSPDLQQLTDSYLNSRRHGTSDWIWFHDQPVEDASASLREIGADPDKPYVCMLTSVAWDAQLHYDSNAFPSMMDWIVGTVQYWKKRTDTQLVIRVHPAEVRGAIPSRQRVVDELEKRIGTLPPNVHIVPPDNQASTYALCDHADAILVYNTKAGVEMASTGKKVVVAGEAWIRGKGFSTDAESPREYYAILDTLVGPQDISGRQLQLARKYAFHFFFRRMIPLPFIEQRDSAHFDLTIESTEDLRPGKWPGLDVICDGILHNRPFELPAESLPAEATGYTIPALGLVRA